MHRGKSGTCDSVAVLLVIGRKEMFSKQTGMNSNYFLIFMLQNIQWVGGLMPLFLFGPAKRSKNETNDNGRFLFPAMCRSAVICRGG